LNYLLIGASAAGLAAAETLRRVDPEGRVTILCRETRPYSRVLLPYLLAGAIEDLPPGARRGGAPGREGGGGD